MNKKRLTKKHYAVILTALELSIADRTDEMVELISEIQDIIEPRTTDELIEKRIHYHLSKRLSTTLMTMVQQMSIGDYSMLSNKWKN
jgi:hypothetical protein